MAATRHGRRWHCQDLQEVRTQWFVYKISPRSHVLCVPDMIGFNNPTLILSRTSLGRVYIYMGKREFVSIDGVIEPIKGVVHIQVLYIAASSL